MRIRVPQNLPSVGFCDLGGITRDRADRKFKAGSSPLLVAYPFERVIACREFDLSVADAETARIGGIDDRRSVDSKTRSIIASRSKRVNSLNCNLNHSRDVDCVVVPTTSDNRHIVSPIASGRKRCVRQIGHS